MAYIFNNNEESVLTEFLKQHIKSFPSGANLYFLSPHPDTSLHCETTDLYMGHPGIAQRVCLRRCFRW